MNKKNPAISVCVTMYNAAAYIGDCINSILCQTFRDFEIVVVDDGSTDGSRRVVESFTDCRIRLVESTHDYISSLNTALRLARGRYIARMDADDLMLPDRLRTEYEYLERHPTVDVVAGQLSYIGEKRQDAYCGKTVTVSLEMMHGGNYIANPTVMMRRSSLVVCGVEYDRDFIYAEDYNFWIDLLAKGLRIDILPVPLVDYRVSDTQVTSMHIGEMMERSEAVKRKICGMLYSDFYDDRALRRVSTGCVVREPRNGNTLTVIMPFLNEREEVESTLRSIRDTVGNRVEVIAINDRSDDGFDYAGVARKYGASYIANSRRMGVAASRDLGVELCRTPYFLLLDSHMRFYDSVWPDRLAGLLNTDDRVLLCCQSRFLGRDDSGKIYTRSESPESFGAVSEFRSDSYWPDIHWNMREHSPNEAVEPIADVLGAGYAASRRYWKRLRGLQGLRKFGCDEALISFKVWREGGRCLLVKDVVIGHIYRDTSPYRHYTAEETSNYLLVSYLMFSQPWYCRSQAVALRKNRGLYEQAMRILHANSTRIAEYRKYMSSIYTRTFDDVLRVHREMALPANCRDGNSKKFNMVNAFVESAGVDSLGLYEGLAGQAVWHGLFGRWKGTSMAGPYIRRLCDAVGAAMDSGSMPWTFSEGTAGIGWALMYMRCRRLSDIDTESLLVRIDRHLESIDLGKVSHRSFATGAGGILAYFVLRIATCGHVSGRALLARLAMSASRIISSRDSDLTSTYYAFFLLDLQKHGAGHEPYIPKISEWLSQAQVLPQNPRYWRPCLYGGCIGAAIRLLENETSDSHQINIS